METDSLFRGSIPVLGKALDIRAFRHSVILSNVANADTPKYKPFDVLVREEMEKDPSDTMPLRCVETHPDHLSGYNLMEAESGRQKDGEELLVLKKDRNKVDMDEEMTALAENHILYNAMAQILAKKFEGLRTAIQGGKR